MLELPRYSFGVGDRFGQSTHAQLAAFRAAAREGIQVTPVWNKSNREHLIVGSEPRETRDAVTRAIEDLGWEGLYFVDADHINRDTVDRYLDHCDYFTIDVADEIGKPVSADEVRHFVSRHEDLLGELPIPGAGQNLRIDRDTMVTAARHYLHAVKQAGHVHRYIQDHIGTDFATEVSLDETAQSQSPETLLVILAAVADEGVPVQTIAPKFIGRFNKGVDYEGDVARFAASFDAVLGVIEFAVLHFDLPKNLKVSVHTGSDKFSLYEEIKQTLHRRNAGVHVKTAGTSWLEELTGLAESGGEAYALVKRIYRQAFMQCQSLCELYRNVIDIAPGKLPTPDAVGAWDPQDFVAALRHDARNERYNANLRQLLHVGFKIAATLGDEYRNLVREHRTIVDRNVTFNILERHIKQVFPVL